MAPALGRPADGGGRARVEARSSRRSLANPAERPQPAPAGPSALQSLVGSPEVGSISCGGTGLRKTLSLHWQRRGCSFVSAEAGSAWAGEGGPGRHPSTGLRAKGPPVLRPTLTSAKEVILVKSKYSVQPGTGKRSLGRPPKPNKRFRLFAPAGVRAGLRQNSEAPPEACRWRFFFLPGAVTTLLEPPRSFLAPSRSFWRRRPSTSTAPGNHPRPRYLTRNSPERSRAST